MKTNNALLGVVAGLAAGAVIGILLAPEKGSKTRKKIADKAENLTSDLKDGINSTLSTLEKKYNELSSKYTNLSDNIEDKIVEGKSKLKEEFSKI